MNRCFRWVASAVASALLVACSSGSGGSSAPIRSSDAPPELALCRTQLDRAHRGTETLLRTAQFLGDREVPNKAGVETGIRVSPDGTRVAFARERTSGRPDSRELFVAPVDSSAAERRLTVNGHLDDAPCWSPDGTRLLYASEASGERRLWITSVDTPQPSEFLAATSAQTDPDWHGPSDRIAFSRFDPILSRWRIALVSGSGAAMTDLTDGGVGSPGIGDREPAFHPDGASLVFVRGPADGGHLWTVDLATGTARPLLEGPRDVRGPVWSPAADRLFAAVAEPTLGRPGHRLSQVRADGSGLVLLDPDKRFGYGGISPFPDLGAMPAASPTPLAVPFGDGDVVIFGLIGPTDLEFLRCEDRTPLIVATVTTDSREVAGVNVNTSIPEGTAPEDVLEIRVRIVAAARRIGGDTVLRAGIRNHVARRSDTVVEIEPGDTGFMELAFATASLAHVDREGFVSVEVIADVEAGARTELWVDLVEIEIVVREP